ncbi:MAG: ATP-binding protein [Candidatus Delongbacteria bacterium]
MDAPLFSLVEPVPPGFTPCYTFSQRDFRARPFALFAASLSQGEAFLGDLLPKLCGILVTAGEGEPLWEHGHPLLYHLRVPAGLLPQLAQTVRPTLHLLGQLRDRADAQTLLQLELNRALESRNRMAAEFDGIRSGLVREIDERRRALRRLEESEQRLQSIYDASPDGILVADVESLRFVTANARMCQMLDRSPEEVAALAVPDIHPPDVLTHMLHTFTRQAEGVDMTATDVPLLRRDGTQLFTDVNAQPVTLGDKVHLVGLFRDATERRRLEQEHNQLQERLLQSQKMESIGRLAGGVAHDFNNMLGVIVGYTDLLLRSVPAGAPHHLELQEIHNAAQRSADLTRQLLAFARKQPILPRVLDLAETVGGLLGILQRLIGEHIQLEWRADSQLWPVRMDSSQVDQILTNLCVNARDAIAGGGRIELDAVNLSLTAAQCAGWADAQPGEFVRLCVRDTGQGMPAEVLEHVFEPFFTTKGLGQGTGLGLATVYGIVRQNHGFVRVESAPGQGTCVAVYLPRHVGEADRTTAAPAAPPEPRREEIVLLVEDEPRLLALCQRLLSGMGYHVLAADCPATALQLAADLNGRLGLLVTDVIMPGMNGRDLAAQLRERHPGLRCLFMSGYTADILDGPDGPPPGHFLQKPFSLKDLAGAVRQVLTEAIPA